MDQGTAQLVALLERVLQPDTAIREQAEQTLQALENQASFCSHLLAISSNSPQYPLNIRLSSVIYLKNIIRRAWVARSGSFAISDEEKEQIRERTLRLAIEEPTGAVSAQAKQIISLIARSDWPHKWSSLVPSLSSIIRFSLDTHDTEQGRVLVSIATRWRALGVLYAVVQVKEAERGSRKVEREGEREKEGRECEVKGERGRGRHVRKPGRSWSHRTDLTDNTELGCTSVHLEVRSTCAHTHTDIHSLTHSFTHPHTHSLTTVHTCTCTYTLAPKGTYTYSQGPIGTQHTKHTHIPSYAHTYTHQQTQTHVDMHMLHTLTHLPTRT